MMAHHPPIPTLGYPSQTAAIIALYERGVAPSVIAFQTGASLNSVTRSIHKQKSKTGVAVAVVTPARRGRKDDPRSKMPHSSGWVMRNYLKSIRGAREALEAAGL